MTEQQLYEHLDAKKSLGNQGEDFVLDYERRRLSQHPQVGNVSIVGRADVALGYDIVSFEGLTSQCHDIVKSIPGATAADEIGLGVKYLLLYNVCNPRSYHMYSVKSASVASREVLCRMAYPNPRCPAYVLYHLSGDFGVPAIDIMSLLRSYNDKVSRTSGTPIFLPGSALRRFFIDTTAARMAGTAVPKRIFTNEGKLWTSLQSQQLEVLASMHKDIATIAHTLKRTPAEIHVQLRVLGLE